MSKTNQVLVVLSQKDRGVIPIPPINGINYQSIKASDYLSGSKVFIALISKNCTSEELEEIGKNFKALNGHAPTHKITFGVSLPCCNTISVSSDDEAVKMIKKLAKVK